MWHWNLELEKIYFGRVFIVKESENIDDTLKLEEAQNTLNYYEWQKYDGFCFFFN